MFLRSFSNLQVHARLVVLFGVLCALLIAAPTLFAQETSDGAAGDTTTVTAEAPAPDPAPDSTDTTVVEQTTSDAPAADDVSENTGGNETTGEDTASIDTGDAAANADLERVENTNDTTVVGADETNVANVNDADVESDAEVTSTSGDNIAVARDTVTIRTGIAQSTANVLNVVNTNTFNAQGLFYFLNMLMGNIALDLRNLFTVLMGGTPDLGAGSTCDLDTGTCGGDPETSLTIDNTNSADVSTDLTVGASSASNTGVAGDGTVDITTGDAYAGANVMNIVNTNVTNANYLLLTMNGFGGGDSDVIFPGAEWFYELLRGGSSIPAGSSVTFENDNTANVTTQGTIAADTGDNAAAAPTASIETGDADASTNIINRVNTNIFGDSISLLFRVSDNWNGKVFGLPEGWSWRQTPAGVEIVLDAPLSAGTLADSAHPYELTNRNTNVANVDTTFNVFALTGDNMAAAGEEANIDTGDAEAGANVLNVVNTNVLGRNWVLAIFNILGDWDGDITFGQPDLWVGARAITPAKIRNGTCFSYELTVNNFGDAAAEDVYLNGHYNHIAQSIPEMESAIDERVRYHLGRIAARESRTITLPACISDSALPHTAIDTTFEVTSEQTDADQSNNTDVISLVTTVVGGGGLLKGAVDVPNADLTIEKTVSTAKITASSTVDYTIKIVNHGPQINYALLVDTIYDQRGAPIHEERWGLEQIYEDEEIILSYTATFNDETQPGTYTNRARVTGTVSDTTDGEPIQSPIASAEVQVLPSVTETLEACQPLLTSYIRFGATNEAPEVRKLQHFLRTTQGASDVPLSGDYDRDTYNAVRAFQAKYADEVLTPWGVQAPTGFVYYTTQKKVNEIWCLRDFPLSAEQQAEIEAFKTRVNTQDAGGTPVPAEDFERIGMAPAAKPESDTTELALAETAPAREEKQEEVHLQVNDQVANVAEAAAEASGLWTSLRKHMNTIFTKWW